MRSVLAVLAVFIGFGVACGDEGGDEPSGAVRYIEEKTEYWRVFCTCADGETEVQPADAPCVQMYLERNDCEEEVLEEEWDDLETSAECLMAAHADGTECLRQACGVERCLMDFGNASQRCPQAAPEAFAAACD